MSIPDPSPRSYLLELPTELRLQIYEFALADGNSITITSAAVSDTPEKPQTPLTDIPGLPANHIPLVRTCYDASLLDISNATTVPNTQSYSRQLPPLTWLTLLQTNRQIHDELTAYVRRNPANLSEGGIQLYVTYPHGVIVLNSLYPTLLQHARCVYVSGYYNGSKAHGSSCRECTTSASSSTSSNPLADTIPRAATPPRPSYRIRVRLPPTSRRITHLPPHPPPTTTTAHAALATLTRTLLPPTPLPLFRKLETRFFYPDENAYSSVWGDERSPVVETLRNICGGRIDMEVWRGRRGTGVLLVAQSNPRSRVISTVWRKLGDSREESEGFVVGGGLAGGVR